jgi:D-glycero-D-manno-heptose 1,7-bisphosphate phosphatase
MISCVFFDRDGVVNRAPVTRYVEKREDFHVMKGFLDTLAAVNALGFEAIIVTNQKGLSTGKIPLGELTAMHDYIEEIVSERGLRLLDIMYCDASNDDHPNRKPNPGMLLDAAKKHKIDLAKSWMIGDSETDVMAGKRAGCHTIFVGSKPLKETPDYKFDDMDHLAASIINILPPAGRS